MTNKQLQRVVIATAFAYDKHGRPPTPAEVTKFARGARIAIPVAVVSKHMGTKAFRTAIEARGLRWEIGTNLTVRQMRVLELLLDPIDKRSYTDKLKAAGVAGTTYRAWLKDPLFYSYLFSESDKSLQDSIPAVNAALINQAEKGDTQAIRLVYEVTGKHDPARKQVMDVTSVLSAVVEIIQQEVTDPTTLDRIATKMKMLATAANPMGVTIPGELTDYVNAFEADEVPPPDRPVANEFDVPNIEINSEGVKTRVVRLDYKETPIFVKDVE